jgi:hypothetical protein
MELSFEMHFNTHSVKVTKLDNGEIRCWKIKPIDQHNTRVDFQLFNNTNDASDFIITPFPSISWNINFDC